MTEYFTAHEVLEKVEGLNSLSTLNKWASFIQKECDYQFHYDYIPFASHTKTRKTMNHRKTRLFSLEEIQKFQKVVSLMETLGRDNALRQLFDQQHSLETMKHSELMEEIIQQVNVMLASKDGQFQVLLQKCQQLQKSYQTLYQQVAQLKETLHSKEQTSSGWFRRKR